MNPTNRARIKLQARTRVTDRALGAIELSLIYLLLTDWLSCLLDFTLENPLIQISSHFSTLTNTLLNQALEAGATTMPDLQPIYTSTFAFARTLLASPLQQVFLFVSLVFSLYSIIVSYGYKGCALGLFRGQPSHWSSLFDPLNNAGRVILASLLCTIFTAFGLAFFLLPGIYIHYSLFMVPYIMAEQPDLTALQALRVSRQLTRGHKMELLMMDLSFVLWMFGLMMASNLGYRMGALLGSEVLATLFSLVLFAIPGCLVIPYREITRAGYYELFRPQDL